MVTMCTVGEKINNVAEDSSSLDFIAQPVAVFVHFYAEIVGFYYVEIQ